MELLPLMLLKEVNNAPITYWYLYNTNINSNSLFYYSKIQSSLIMALSETVIESLKEAESSLRNALSFASRTERPSTVAHIAKLMSKIDTIIHTDDVLDMLEERETNPNSRGHWTMLHEDEDA